MKNYIKNEIKHIPTIIVMFVLFYGITTLASSYLFKANEVEFDNTNTNIESTNVGDAIDELYTAANNFATYDTRLQGVENTIGTGSLTTTNNTLIGGINEVNSKITQCIKQGSTRVGGKIYEAEFSTSTDATNAIFVPLDATQLSINAASIRILEVYIKTPQNYYALGPMNNDSSYSPSYVLYSYAGAKATSTNVTGKAIYMISN